MAVAENATYRNALPLGSMLLEYRLESVLGAGGFGMTYLAYDTHLEVKVAIKEYLPVELAVRAADGCIFPASSGTEFNYESGLERFLREARLLARFRHPNIVAVTRYFEANGTAYMVMNYQSGLSLSQMLKRIPRPDEELLMRILMPLLDGLHAVHEAGFLHRDIKPSNLFIRDTGVPVLLDFGAARLAIGGATRTMTWILTPGYAPLEQYSKDGNQGPWTDIYSLAAVFYRAVIGDNPPDVVTRLTNDPVLATLNAARDRFTAGFLHGIQRGLEVDAKSRPQSVTEWKAMFTGEAGGAPAPSPAVGLTQRMEKALLLERGTASTRRPSMSHLTWIAAATLMLFLVIGGQQLFDRLYGDDAGSARDAAKAGKDKPAGLTPREFYILDRDRSGYLTPDEVKGDAMLEQNFKKIDKNRDGRISLDEFTSFP